MHEITYKVPINAPPDKVFEALTETQHIAKWWTPDCDTEAQIGGRADFEFKAADGSLDGYSRMRIERLVPSTLLEWKCLDQNFQGDTDWTDTTIRFALTDNGTGGTDLDFAHLNWKDKDGCYNKCVDGWAHVLKTSLKNYLETGKGEPYCGHR